ncbi:hypothetical protein EI94DRAFT_1703489 [Lactarius quietus]|nr:hypothetical protein EI94DRAFT_1703489 [Lactarius quietus]
MALRKTSSLSIILPLLLPFPQQWLNGGSTFPDNRSLSSPNNSDLSSGGGLPPLPHINSPSIPPSNQGAEDEIIPTAIAFKQLIFHFILHMFHVKQLGHTVWLRWVLSAIAGLHAHMLTATALQLPHQLHWSPMTSLKSFWRPTPWHGESGKARKGSHLTIEFVRWDGTSLRRQHVYPTDEVYGCRQKSEYLCQWMAVSIPPVLHLKRLFFANTRIKVNQRWAKELKKLRQDMNRKGRKAKYAHVQRGSGGYKVRVIDREGLLVEFIVSRSQEEGHYHWVVITPVTPMETDSDQLAAEIIEESRPEALVSPSIVEDIYLWEDTDMDIDAVGEPHIKPDESITPAPEREQHSAPLPTPPAHQTEVQPSLEGCSMEAKSTAESRIHQDSLWARGVTEHQMNTRVKNKTAHPGCADKLKTHQTAAQVAEECMAKAQAKSSHEEAKQNSIKHMAEFEVADLAEEDLVDATLHPLFTPKKRPQCWNPAYSGLTSITVMSEVDTSNFDGALFKPAKSATPTKNDSSESDAPAPTSKKLKSCSNATSATTGATTRRTKHVDKSEDETMASHNIDQDTEPCRVPKAKKQAKKTMVRDEINMATKTIKEHSYGNMVDVMSQGPKDAGSQRGWKKKHCDLSLSKKRRHCDMINEWAAGVPNNAAPASCSVPSHIMAPTSYCSKTLSKTGVPSLTTGTSRSCSSVPSINSCNVKTVSHHSEVSAGKKAEPKDSELIATMMRLRVRNGWSLSIAPQRKEELVVLKSSKSASNKRSDKLPSFIEAKWFQATFVSTYMTFVAQTMDPCNVPVAQALEVMQKIWDATSSFKYKIETSSTSSAVYQKHSSTLKCNSKTQTRASNFAKGYLEDLCFLYKDSKHKDKKVWALCSPLVIQTFAAHLMATEGAQVVPNLHGPQLEQTPMATGGLGLATASDSTHQMGFSDAAWGKVSWSYAKSARALSIAKFGVIVQVLGCI